MQQACHILSQTMASFLWIANWMRGLRRENTQPLTKQLLDLLHNLQLQEYSRSHRKVTHLTRSPSLMLLKTNERRCVAVGGTIVVSVPAVSARRDENSQRVRPRRRRTHNHHNHPYSRDPPDTSSHSENICYFCWTDLAVNKVGDAQPLCERCTSMGLTPTIASRLFQLSSQASNQVQIGQGFWDWDISGDDGMVIVKPCLCL